MRTQLPALLAALLALAAPLGTRAALPPLPSYLQLQSFSPHPMKCNPNNPMWVSYEWWWQDEEFTGVVQPLGHHVQRGCMPYNRVLPRVGKLNVETLMHQSPALFRNLQIRMRRPNWVNIPGIQPVPKCNAPSLMDPGQHYGPVGCQYNLWRPSLTPWTCKKTGGRLAKAYSLGSNDPAASRIDCAWRDGIPYDTTVSPSSGNHMFELMSHFVAYAESVPQLNLTKMDQRMIQVLGAVPLALADAAGAPCAAPWCNWAESSMHTLEVKTWTDDTQFTKVSVAPLFTVPVGGIWRLQMSASRIVEPPPPNAKYPGYPVKRHIITFDDDFRAGKAGSVQRNRTGMMYDEMVVMNLTATGLAPGWHKMTVQGKTTDGVTRGVQTASLSTYVEVVPPCPPSNDVPFMTHVLKDAAGSIDVRQGKWSEAPGGQTYRLFNSIPTLKLNYLQLTFDLSFLSPDALVSNATLFMFLSNPFPVTAELARVPLDVYDGSKSLKAVCSKSCPAGTNGASCFLCPPGSASLSAAVPCAKPACAGLLVGRGSFKGSDSLTHVQLNLNTGFVNKYAGTTRLMSLTVVMPRLRTNELDGATFRASQGPSAPFLMMRASCSGKRRR